jgi:guanylate kinase
MEKGLLVVVSGPAGSGKGTVNKILMDRPDYAFSVSATTRAPRPGEVDGVNYHYISVEEFEKRIAADELLEYTKYCGNYYGTLKKETEAVLESGRNLILEIEVEGAMNVKRLCPDSAVLIMLLPPTYAVQEQRLRGRATETEGLRKVAVVGGGVGCAIAYPVAKKLFECGCEVHSIVGFRNRDLVILEDEFRANSSRFVLMSDDGSCGEKGLVTDALRRLIESGEKYDRVMTIGPLIMMKFVCALTKEYGIPTVASMNPIMIDGTGMCGGCRLTVGGETKFACVDGPEFDGHLIDFDEAMARSAMYKPFERHAHEETCNLFKKN